MIQVMQFFKFKTSWITNGSVKLIWRDIRWNMFIFLYHHYFNLCLSCCTLQSLDPLYQLSLSSVLSVSYPVSSTTSFVICGLKLGVQRLIDWLQQTVTNHYVCMQWINVSSLCENSGNHCLVALWHKTKGWCMFIHIFLSIVKYDRCSTC